jgi:DNA-binding transcriptional regulator YhcF (GntR family)
MKGKTRKTRQKVAKRPFRRARPLATLAAGKTKKRTRKAVKKPKKILKHKKTIKKTHKKAKLTKKHRKATKKIKRHKASKPRISVGKGILEQLFESQAKVKLMRFFFRNQIDTFSLREILKMLRMNSNAVRREVKKLEKIGLIGIRKKQGRMVYSLNDNFDFLKELQELILKSTISSKSELINNVKKIGNIKLLVLGGIFRNNQADGADILIVGDKINQRKSTTFLKDLEAEVGRELNCSVMSAKEFNYRYDMYDRFVRDIISENKDILINKLNLW